MTEVDSPGVDHAVDGGLTVVLLDHLPFLLLPPTSSNLHLQGPVIRERVELGQGQGLCSVILGVTVSEGRLSSTAFCQNINWELADVCNGECLGVWQTDLCLDFILKYHHKKGRNIVVLTHFYCWGWWCFPWYRRRRIFPDPTSPRPQLLSAGRRQREDIAWLRSWGTRHSHSRQCDPGVRNDPSHAQSDLPHGPLVKQIQKKLDLQSGGDEAVGSWSDIQEMLRSSPSARTSLSILMASIKWRNYYKLFPYQEQPGQMEVSNYHSWPSLTSGTSLRWGIGDHLHIYFIPPQTETVQPLLSNINSRVEVYRIFIPRPHCKQIL